MELFFVLYFSLNEEIVNTVEGLCYFLVLHFNTENALLFDEKIVFLIFCLHC